MGHFIIITDPDSGLESAYYPEHGNLPDDGGGSFASQETEAHYPVARCYMVGEGENKPKFILLNKTQSEKLVGHEYPDAQGQMRAYMDQIFKGVFVPRE